MAKDASNPFFKNKYASLDSIIDEARPVLTKNGLSILQLPSGDGEHAIMKTLLLHESGEWIESEALIIKPVKSDPQAYGSCISYMRRYSLTSFLSLNTGEDDDANASSGKTLIKTPSTPSKTPTPSTSNIISESQQKRLYAISKGNNELAKKVLAKYNYASSKVVENKDYTAICNEIEALVKAHE